MLLRVTLAPHAAPDAATFRILTSLLCRAGQPSASVNILRGMPPLLLNPGPAPLPHVLASLLLRGASGRDVLGFLNDMRCRVLEESRAFFQVHKGGRRRVHAPRRQLLDVAARSLVEDGVLHQS